VVKTDRRLAARCAAIASLGAAVIHGAVTPMHWREWVPAGAFFAVLAAFQLIWAFVAWSRPGTWVLLAGVFGNGAVAALWVVSCTSGPPFGPSAGEPEPVGAAGICVLLLQCYVVMGAGWAWSRKYPSDEVPGMSSALILMGANTIMAAAVTVSVVASVHGHHHHGGPLDAQSEHHGVHEDLVGGHSYSDGHSHMSTGTHGNGDESMQDHHHPTPTPSPPASGATPAPLAEPGRPVTDMALDTDHPQTDGPSTGAATESGSEPAISAPSAADSPQAEVGDAGEEHHHDHDD
jgi:hypothetical protein